MSVEKTPATLRALAAEAASLQECIDNARTALGRPRHPAPSHTG
ncbi:hypothetical protein [Streptomyces sp. VN1]|nr:hypothetical protein [Streptomyces sp. VN1]